MSPEHILFDIKEHIRVVCGQELSEEPSNVVYLSIVDMHADSLEAMAEVATMLYKEYVVNTTVKHLVVVGDAKTYLRLHELKYSYGSELEWLIPFIGD